MNNLEKLKQFVFNGALIKDSINSLGDQGISISGTEPPIAAPIEETDFSPRVVYDAKKMSAVFIAFFCMENSARELISQRLAERKGISWWENCVPNKIRESVSKLKEKEEKNRYHSQRSISNIGYSMFGNLGQIIISNWEEFSDLFPSQAWVTSRFDDLEMSRNVIMHTGILPEIEIERIESIVRDWVRQVG